ncbi:MAG: Ig-like domain-containing protein [Clostridiales bacterium]|nr:Ig-like domain-containing protein [Clostridiales bacterium]
MATRKHIANRILAMICVAALVIMQGLFVLPEVSHAASGGLVVRVQYAGERGDKIRTKCTFSDSELASMDCGTYRYNNITRVGTVMRSIAYGPTITSIIENAGIDLDSVTGFAFKTSDGYAQHSFDIGKYLYTPRYYYGNLWLFQSNERTIEKNGVRPIELYQGALNGPERVPAILGLKYYSTKSTSGTVTASKMKCDNGLRFFVGQTDLSYLEYIEEEPFEPEQPEEPQEPTTPDPTPEEPDKPSEEQPDVQPEEDKENTNDASAYQNEPSLLGTGTESKTRTVVKYHETSAADVTSMDSIYKITGIDIILSGSPGINGISLGTDGTNVKIGGTKQITAKVDGDFQGFSNSDLTWTTSDSSKATVDRNGKVTIHGKGAVTITATAENGISASITLNGTAEGKTEAAGKSGGKKGKGKNEEKNAATMKVREIVIGDEITPKETPEDSGGQNVSADAEALEAAEEFSAKTVAASAAVAAAACCGGIVFRIRKYHLDMGKVIKKEK